MEDEEPLVRTVQEEDIDAIERRVSSYEDIINSIGLGRFHVKLLLLCGWANASDAVEVLCISLILSSVSCELQLTNQQLGVLTAVIFIGMMLGGYFWGSIGDISGRRTVLVLSLFVNGLFGLMSSFATSYWFFVFSRFFSGVGVGGSIPVIWSFFVEWIPAYCRGRMLSMLASFWMIGQILIAGLAWYLIPYERGAFSIFGFSMTSWRVFMILSTFVCLSSSILITLLPESPKYLLYAGKREEAVKILELVHRTNKSRCDLAQIRALCLDDEEIKRRRSSSLRRKSQILWLHTKELFGKSNLRNTLSLLCINFSIAFGYYGLMLWFPELFTKARASGIDGPVCRSNSLINTSSSSLPIVDFCQPANTTVFRDTFLIAGSNFPGNVVAILFLDKFGRKRMFVIALILSAVCAFFIWFVENQAEVLLMSCIFSCVSTVAWNCLDCFGVETYPTHLRSTAIGISLAFARVGAIFGNLTFGFMIQSNCAVPIVSVAALLCVGAVASTFLPEKTKQSIS